LPCGTPIAAVGVPTMKSPFEHPRREEFRHKSLIAPVCVVRSWGLAPILTFWPWKRQLTLKRPLRTGALSRFVPVFRLFSVPDESQHFVCFAAYGFSRLQYFLAAN